VATGVLAIIGSLDSSLKCELRATVEEWFSRILGVVSRMYRKVRAALAPLLVSPEDWPFVCVGDKLSFRISVPGMHYYCSWFLVGTDAGIDFWIFLCFYTLDI
jgi:hypothetical protein